jgi:pimeloyl-ACP methyl ester carboxylesterase
VGGQAVYADINGLKMFYEIRGTPDPAKVPVVLLHGAISATGTSFEVPCRTC